MYSTLHKVHIKYPPALKEENVKELILISFFSFQEFEGISNCFL